ncbi:MAG: hypothetical protein HY983_03025 [Candidatus Magasanikbacteria bacterium]|nr:hypothetical protein [Candidatus Magasanikbacteria bacterium]
MQIIFPKSAIPDPQHFIRRAGYGLIVNRRKGETSFVRRFTRDLYPRFHLYIEDRGENWQFNLHLDQRAPVYVGVTAHSGDYDGPVVEQEKERVKNLLSAYKAHHTRA